MFFKIKQLLHLPVLTELGTKLGVVRDIEFEVESHTIRTYLVGRKLLGGDKYLIVPAQVKAITPEYMIVKEGVVSESQPVTPKTKTATPQLMTPIREK